MMKTALLNRFLLYTVGCLLLLWLPVLLDALLAAGRDVSSVPILVFYLLIPFFVVAGLWTTLVVALQLNRKWSRLLPLIVFGLAMFVGSATGFNRWNEPLAWLYLFAVWYVYVLLVLQLFRNAGT